MRSASAVQGVDFEAVASAYDVAARWTAPYLVSAVDRVLQQLNPQATGDVRFLFVTADDTVPWIVGRLAPDFARDHALWVQWPPTPTGWRHLRAQHPSMLITDDPASLPAARPLLPPGTPAGWLVSRLHGPVPDSSALTAAQRSVARAAVVAVVRAAMVAGPADGRAAVYAAAAQLDEAARLRSRAAPAEHGSAPHDPRAAAVLDHRPLDPLLAHWLQQQY